MTAANSIMDLLAAPLDADWTVERLAEEVLGVIVAQPKDQDETLRLDATTALDRQSQRILRPLLACLAMKSAAESGTPPSLYGGRVSFKRSGPEGPVWILGEFENRAGNVRVSFRRSDVAP